MDGPKLRVARAASLHMRRVDGRVMAVQTANSSSVVSLVDSNRRLFSAHLGIVFGEGEGASVVAGASNLRSIAVTVSWLLISRCLLWYYVLDL